MKRPSFLRRSTILLLLCSMVHSMVHAFVPLSARSPVKRLSRPSPRRRASCFSPNATTQRTATTTTTSLALSFPTALPSSQSLVAWWYLSLCAILFGTQPFFQKKYVPKTICRSTVVLAQELTKILTAGSLLWASGGWEKAIVGKKK